jgi:hypothetical protein
LRRKENSSFPDAINVPNMVSPLDLGILPNLAKILLNNDYGSPLAHGDCKAIIIRAVND